MCCVRVRAFSLKLFEKDLFSEKERKTKAKKYYVDTSRKENDNKTMMEKLSCYINLEKKFLFKRYNKFITEKIMFANKKIFLFLEKNNFLLLFLTMKIKFKILFFFSSLLSVTIYFVSSIQIKIITTTKLCRKNKIF